MRLSLLTFRRAMVLVSGTFLLAFSMPAATVDFRLSLPAVNAIQAPSDPVVTSASPGTLTRGQSYTLMLTGRNLSSRMRVLLGEGMDVGMPMVMGTTAAQVSVTVRPGAPLGQHPVTVIYGNQRQNGPASVTVVDSGQAPVSAIGTTIQGSTPPPPATSIAVPGAPPPLPAPPGMIAPITAVAVLNGISPAQWVVGQTYTLNLNGSGFTAGMELDFGAGIKPVGQVAVFNASMAQARIEVDAEAKPGQRGIRMRSTATQSWQSTGRFAWVMPLTQTYSGSGGAVPKPRPKLFPITRDIVFKKGVVVLDEPERYVHIDVGGGKDTAQLLHDAVVFKWHEKNPGTADFYEFRILSVAGKVLMKKRLETKLSGNYLPPPTYYQPDAAFLDALLNPQAGPVPAIGASGANSSRGRFQTSKKPSFKAATPNTAALASALSSSSYPEGTDLLWEVAGFRVFGSDGVSPTVHRAALDEPIRLAAAPGQNVSDAPMLPGLPGMQGVGLKAVEKPQPVEMEVEISERWPLRRPNRPNGFGACPLDGQNSQLRVENRDRGKGETLVSAVNYVGDELLIAGQVDLTASPYTSHPGETAYNPPPSTPSGQATPQPGSSGVMPSIDVDLGPTQVTDHQFGNLFVDWGDGVVVPMTLKAGAAGDQSGLPFDRSEVMEVPDSQAYAEQQAGQPSPYPQFFAHQYDAPGAYNVRVYQLSEHDVQDVNPAQLDQAYSAGQNNGPYFRVGRAGGQIAVSPAGKDIADRAYVLYCRAVKIEPYQDPVAYGALWLNGVEIVGFGAPKATQSAGVARVSAQKAAQPISAGAAKATGLRSGLQAAAKAQPLAAKIKTLSAAARLSDGIDAVCSGCNKAFTAHAVLSYFGTGDIQVEWKVRLQNAHGPVKAFANTLSGNGPSHVPASPAREGNPKEWGAPESGSFDLYSPPLPVNPAAVYEVWAEVKLAPKTLAVSNLNSLQSFRNGLAPAVSSDGAKRGRQPKLGILRPFKEAAKGAPAVLYVDTASLASAAGKMGLNTGLAGRLEQKPGGLAGKLMPASVTSEHKKYRVTAIDPNKPCEFAFPGQGGDRFRVFLDKQDMPQDSAGNYSGSGTLDLKLASGNGAAAAIPVGIDFQGWKVDLSGNVAAGTPLKRTVDLPVAPVGLSGALVKLDAVAGQRMDATLELDAADSLFRKQGSNDAIHWQATAPLRASGDWTAKGKVDLAALGWTGFYLESPEATLDISNAEGSHPAACPGPAGAGWTGVHLGQAQVEVNTMDLATVKVPVSDWGITNGVCGKLDLVNDPQLKNLTVGKGTVSFNRIHFEAGGGKMDASYNFDAHLPWLDVDLHADNVPLVPGQNSFDFAGVKPAGNVSRNFGPIHMDVNKDSFRFGADAGGWRAITDPSFTFKAEGKDFLASPLKVPNMRFGMNGRAWFDEQAASSRDIPLSGTASLGKTQFDLTSVNLVGGAGGSDRLVANFHGKLNLSKALPAADVQVDYRISGDQYAGSGPFSAPFTIKTAFPPGQPTAEATIAPVYAPTSGQETRYLGSVDLALFGGPPIKGEFLLGYQGSEDYWLTRVNVPLGSGVPLVPPFLTLYQVRGGLGYNMALNAFKDAGSLENAQSSIGKGSLFMAGMRVGSPDRFAYMLDGDFTVSPGAGGGRMDFRAWLLKNQQSGNGDFQGFFQYAGGNFDGRLWGHLGMLNDAIAFDLGDSESNAAVDLHFGGGWYLYAGKKAGPRIRAKVITSDSDSYLMLGSDVGLAVGGGQHYYLGVGSSSVASAYVKGYMDIGMQITPQPHVAGDFGAGAEAGVCVAGGCESMGVNAAVHAEALPVTVRAHATVEFPWPLPDVSFDVHM